MISQEQKLIKELGKTGSLTTKSVAEDLSVSREYAHRLLSRLVAEGQLILVGKTNRAQYIATGDPAALHKAKHDIRNVHFRLRSEGLQENEVFSRLESETGIMLDLSDNVRRLVQYGFTEMLNNAIDHSRSPNIEVDCRRSETAITFVIRDFGIGIFNNVRETFRLDGTLSAIREILKGKTTTAPEAHSGQGVFFTSKMADVFNVDSFEKRLSVNNLVSDIFIIDRRMLKGTRVSFSVHLASERKIANVFAEFTTETDDGSEFDRTRITVRLFQFGKELPSRSEAKRVTVNLENWREVELDFTGVASVGQAFADEIFRVWASRHSNVKLIATNANEIVAFMIKRAGGTIGQEKLAL